MKLASYNIHKAVGTDRRRDPARIIAVLRELNADVIALQEADERLGERETVLPRAALDDTPWKVVPIARRPRSIGWHGNALLVRRSMTIAHCEPLDMPTLEPRGAVCADLEHEGHLFRIVGTHLDLSGLRRRSQVRHLLGHMEAATPACPEVLMGDFNQWRSSAGAMDEFGPQWRALSPGRSYPGVRPIARFDRMVVSKSWRIVEQGVHHSALATRASDHLPIWAALELP
nr:endonuclease/exonuclease/phosphatase family protein [Erythrobacter sp. LQ02-29]